MEEILSVGIDIGTATTQVVFSRLQVENTSAAFAAPKAEIISREIIYRGGVHPTPLLSFDRIDSACVRRLVLDAYQAAGVRPDQVRTGAVIVTGETACKENARAVLQELSDMAGDFVVYTAGPDLESLLAGKGSGAQEYSRIHRLRIANLDIGGGTTNIAVFDCGALVGCGCLDIGGRLIRLDSRQTVSYMSPRAALVADRLRLQIRVGSRADLEQLSRLCDGMNQVLEQAMGLAPPDSLAWKLATPGSSPFAPATAVDAVCFSGGVADCIGPAEDDPFAYGDIGILLGQSIHRGLAVRIPPIGSAETIRATVIGAGTQTMCVSGSTISCSDRALPIRNLPVLCFPPEAEERLLAGDRGLLEDRLRWILAQCDGENALIYLGHLRDPGYAGLERLASVIVAAADAVLCGSLPVLVATRWDMAKALGHQIDWRAGDRRPTVCVDGIEAVPGDYVDIGSPLLGGMTVPVVVKTLLFGAQGGPK